MEEIVRLICEMHTVDLDSTRLNLLVGSKGSVLRDHMHFNPFGLQLLR
jgi:hypothetical protein